MARSLLGRLGDLAAPKAQRVARAMTRREVGALRASWDARARPEQRPPDGPWRTWLVMAGRGFGKTRLGAEFVHDFAMTHPGCAIALVGATLHDARSVMVEGASGLLTVAHPADRPDYFASRRLVRWDNGATARLFSAEEPDTLRGPQFHLAWGDEIARWPNGPAAWANLRLTLRQGIAPRAVLTTTPRPVALVKGLLAAGTDARVAVTRGRTADNAANLPAAFVDEVTAAYGGTRLGRQELDGELIEDVEGALWTREMIEACRAPSPRSPDGESPSPSRGEGEFRRVVVGVDPPGSSEGDACGIVVAALGADPSTGSGRAYVLADRSVRGLRPEGWAAAVAGAAAAFGADKVIAEANNGGEMVESVLRAVEANLPVKIVHASRGKVARAEPVAGLYAAGRVCHRGVFPALEDEMCGMVAGGGYEGPGRSPDRADALVWALTELMLGAKKPGPRIRAL